MKHSYILHIFLLLFLFLTPFIHAATLNDDFEVNDGGWINHKGIVNAPTPINSKVLNLAYQDYTFKTYDFGIAAANADITINFNFAAVGTWENNDYFGVYFNGAWQYYNSISGTDGNTDLVTQSFSFTTTLDSTGKIILYTYINSSNSSEEGYIDNVILSTIGTPPTMGNIPDSTVQEGSLLNINLSNSVTATDGDPILNYTLTCTPLLSGVNFNTSTGLLNGYPTTAGTYNCNATATDKDGESNSDDFSITITAAPQTPPIMLSIPNIYITVNTPTSIDLSTYVVPTNGDTVTYTLTGSLPSGLSFDSTSGSIGGQPTTEINATLTLLASDNDGDSNTSTFTLIVQPISTINTNFRDFSLRYQQTFPGKMLTIGNTVLVAPDNQSDTICDTYTNGSYISNANQSNDTYQLCKYHEDGNVIFHTTKAQLSIPILTVEKIKWAGLYWQALVEDNINIENMQIKLKHSQTNTYKTIDYTTLDYQTANGIIGYTSYSAFADVTQYFLDSNWTNGDVTVGDIPIKEGKVDALGTYGAWTLVVIYEDTTEPLQNFSVYDGWQQVDANNENVDINISGFYTPKNAPTIAAQVSVFTAEGDKLIDGDTLEVRPSKKTSFTQLIPNFNSSIQTSVPFNRKPEPTNNQGIDIQSFELGTLGKNIISPEESSMILRFKSVRDHSYDPGIAQDRYFPSMIAFSAQLYTPKICYDYTLSMGDYIPISSDNRDVNTSTFGSLPLKIQFLIRSEEADFTYLDAKANITFTGVSAPNLIYNRLYAEMSPAKINTYFAIADGFDEIESNTTSGQISLGENVIGNLANNGGIITPNQTTYAILGYDVSSSPQIDARFDIHFDAKIQFNPNDLPVNYFFSTDASVGALNYIPRCPTDPIYSPIPLGFNVERVATQNEPISTKYTLPTQITGRPYQVDIVSYTGGLNTDISTPFSYDGVVELELINADAFLNDGSVGYDTTCQNPKSIGEGSLVYFNPAGQTYTGRRTVNIPSDLAGYTDTQAVRNAAFRLWVLSVEDANGSKRVMTHQCMDKTNVDDCFGEVYRNAIDANQTGRCISECSLGNPTGNPDCYKCLKNNYATAVCSRDNFSIRPESFRIKLSDDNDRDTSVTPISLASNRAGNDIIRLAAGYNYLLEVNATNYLSETKSIGYFNSQFTASDDIVSIPNIYGAGSLAMLEFSSVNDPSCYDKNSSSIALFFENGSLIGTTHMLFSNVGTYEFWLSDSNWTVVDQAAYIYKPTFGGVKVNDCDIATHSSDSSATGCTFYSVQGNKTLLSAEIKPYRFSMSNIDVIRLPDDSKNYSFFNDFSHPYYDDLLLRPINTSVSFIGLLIAKGKHVERLSNFTDSCIATDVTLSTSIITNPADVNATTPLQQYLQHTDVASFSTPVDTKIGSDQNLTLPQVAFPDTQIGDIKPGKAKIFLHTTYTKPKTSPTNPIIANYDAIFSISNANWSKANMVDHVPEGNNTNYDRNITYYFAKVTPFQNFYNDVIESYRITPLSVDIYCGLLSNDCNNSYNLSTDAVNGATNWYAATPMFDDTQDGSTNLSVTTLFGTATPSINPNSNVLFTQLDATRDDINVSIVGNERPITVDIQIEAVPWLTYNPLDLVYGYPHYRIKFIGNSSWSGVGSTGKVTETTSNKETIHRMNW